MANSQGTFDIANKGVAEASYYNVEVTQTATAVAAPQSAPTTSGDGLNLRKSTRGVVFAKPSAGQTCTVQVYVYRADIDDWFRLTEAERVDVDDEGDSWKINTGGADKIAVVVSAISGGTADVWFGRAYV